jgi:hypothetical protein
MIRNWRAWLWPVVITLLSAADAAWRDKPIAEWTAADAQQALKDSPWVKSVPSKFAQQSLRPVIVQPVTPMGRPYGLPRAVGVQRPSPAGAAPTLTLRWESALPMRVAQIKSGNVNAPVMDDDHFAIAVYGLPDHVLGNDPTTFSARLKPEGSLKREGKKNITATEITMLPRDNGSIIVFYFPKKQEISLKDNDIDFSGRVGPIEFEQSFSIGDMVFAGKLEL